MVSNEEGTPGLTGNALLEVMGEMSVKILGMVRRQGLENVLDYSSQDLYRGKFLRVPVRRELLVPWENVLDVDAMSVEMVTSFDERAEVHYHDHAYAIVTILGPTEGIEDPKGAMFAFGSKEFRPVVSGVTLEIRPGTLHGFTSPSGAPQISFLSVQSRRIDKDFHVT